MLRVAGWPRGALETSGPAGSEGESQTADVRRLVDRAIAGQDRIGLSLGPRHDGTAGAWFTLAVTPVYPEHSTGVRQVAKTGSYR